MPFFLRARRLDIATGHEAKVLLGATEAQHFGVSGGDRVMVRCGRRRAVASVDLSQKRIATGTIGLYREVSLQLRAQTGSVVELSLLSRPLSLVAIRKKLLGGKLREEEFSAIVRDILSGALSDVHLTYFVASSFFWPYTMSELFGLTKAIARHGAQMRFPGTVVDKHSIGGLAGNRTTMVVVPIVAAAGLTIPKTSSRAITSPAGTADTMEVLAPVAKTAGEIRKIVTAARGCIVWGGGLDLAPADDKIIKVSMPLSLEPFTKMIVSIMAKKVAMGIRYLVIDMPYGATTKVPSLAVARKIARKFQTLGERFGITTRVLLLPAREPIGRGVGPALEARDVLRVLQQQPTRPHDLERKAIRLAGALLELSKAAQPGKGSAKAAELIRNKAAWRAMQKIIRAQGGNPQVSSEALTAGAITQRIRATRSGRITLVDNRAIDELCRTLGAPAEKLAGVFLHRRIGDRVKRGWKLFTLYAPSRDRLELALKGLRRLTVFRLSPPR